MSTRTCTTDSLVERLSYYDLSPNAYAYARKALVEEPSRGVGQGARNSVCGAYSSPSQGLTIQFESRTAEGAWILRFEFDDAVIGYRDQPPHVDLRKADKNGVVRTISYTPDFILIRRDDVVVVEVKTSSDLESLASKQPEHWQFEGEAWHYRPAEERFNAMGLSHLVMCNAESEQIETSNLRTLIQAIRSGHRPERHVQKQILRSLNESAWLSIADLLKSVDNASYQDIFVMMAQRQVYADLKRRLLTEPTACLVALDTECLIAAESYSQTKAGSFEPISCLDVPGREELNRALARLERIEANDGSRHTRRLKQRMKKLVAAGKSPIQAMVMPRSGNKTSQLSPEAIKAVTDHIHSYYISHQHQPIHASWSNYRIVTKKEYPELRIVSLKTYKRYVNQESAEAVAYGRGGKRAANAAAPASDVLTRALKAQRALERVSVDHCLLKVLVIVTEANGNVYCRRAWLSVMIDDATGYWLASFVTLRDPSKRTLSMLFRTCARNHHRLPETIHSDRGSDFMSRFYRSFSAHFGITTERSPAGHGRFNSEAEELNKQILVQWISKRPGNVVEYKDKRSFSKGYRPADIAVLKLEDLYAEIEIFRGRYNNNLVGTNRASPKIQFDESMERYGFCSGIPIKIDDEFMLVSSFDTDKDYKISKTGEIVKDVLTFTHPDLSRIRPALTRIEIRVDPEDPYKIYCKVDGQWIAAYNSNHRTFQAKNEISRWAEAVIVAEGRPSRDQAKRDGQDLIAADIVECDQKHQAVESSGASAAANEENARTAAQKAKVLDLFAQSRQMPVRSGSDKRGPV